MERLRLNKATGSIFQEVQICDDFPDGLKEIGTHIDVVILWASQPFEAELFNLNYQSWIQVCAMLSGGKLAYFMLGNGKTQGLKPFLHYVNGLREKGFKYYEVKTRVSFKEAYSVRNCWWDYNFQAFEKPGLKDYLAEWLAGNKVQFVDPTLPVDVVAKIGKQPIPITDLIAIPY